MTSMNGDDRVNGNVDGSAPRTGLTAITSNSQYVAFSRHAGFDIVEIPTGRRWTLDISVGDAGFGVDSPFALSPLRTAVLAVCRGHQILVFDVVSKQLLWSISSGGRTINTLSWSSKDFGVLAIGIPTGKILVWNLYQPVHPFCQLAGSKIKCNKIGFSSKDVRVVASVHKNELRAWVSSPISGQVGLITSEHSHFTAFVWHPTNVGRLLASTSDGRVCLYDFNERISLATRMEAPVENEGAEQEILDKFLEGLSPPHLVFQKWMSEGIIDLHWLGNSHALILSRYGYVASILDVRDHQDPKQVWTSEFDRQMLGIQLGGTSEDPTLQAFWDRNVLVLDVPYDIVEAAGWESQSSLSRSESDHLSSPHGNISNGQTGRTSAKISTMKPLSISNLEQDQRKRSRQLEHRLFKVKPKVIDKKTHHREMSETSLPTSRHQNSSRASRRESGSAADVMSPTALLSPQLSSRKVSPGSVIPRPGSAITTPRLPPVFNNIPSKDPNNDSDSDDDTFAAALAGSGTLLPGGVHVPLPKACGALFGPSGHLLTYFPPAGPRPPSALPSDLGEHVTNQWESHENRIARLFPGFGNFLCDKCSTADDADSDKSSDYEDLLLFPHDSAADPIHHASFQSHQSWNPSRLPLKTNLDQSNDTRVVINVSHMPQVPYLLPQQYQLASQLRTLCDSDENGIRVCARNAAVCRDAGCEEAADLWDMLGMLLDDNVPLDRLRTGVASFDALVSNQQAHVLNRSDSGVELPSARDQDGLHGKLRWNEHPFGGTWFIRKLFDFAEHLADVQLLACMSAVLIDVGHSRTEVAGRGVEAFSKRLPSYTVDYLVDPSMLARSTLATQIPILRADSQANTASKEISPIKTQRSDSGPNSRNHSQPITPRLDSPGSIYAAFPWSSLSRQSTRLSGTSGTAPTVSSTSPDMARGSFSAAAKYYAQSVTDKIADKFLAYGTSPPANRGALSKTGSSPRNNELSAGLSSSLPRGSLGKSVSFVSEIESAPIGRLSRSYDGQQDGRRANDDEDYESDRTVARTSTPAPSPRLPKGAVAVKLKNQKAFVEDISGGAKSSLIPHDLKQKSIIWMEHYAEQLRTWGLWEKAADIDKTASLASGNPPAIIPNNPHESAFAVVAEALPTTSNRRTSRNSITASTNSDHHEASSSILLCAICATASRGPRQTCPACLHTSHLGCLQAYAASKQSLMPGGFVCPTGCGCGCADLIFDGVVDDVGAVEEEAVQQQDDLMVQHFRRRSFMVGPPEERKRANSVRTVVKKSSFTDPRRWRARVEGDSW